METPYGNGSAYYVGTRLNDEGIHRLYDRVPGMRGAAAGHAGKGPAEGVERVSRRCSGHVYEFLVNHSDAQRERGARGAGIEMLTGQLVEDEVAVGPRAVAIVRYDGDQGLG